MSTFWKYLILNYFLLEVLNEYYPEAIIKSPSVGRQGKALRRQQQQRRIVESQLHFETSEQQSFDQEDFDIASSSLESAESIIGKFYALKACLLNWYRSVFSQRAKY